MPKPPTIQQGESMTILELKKRLNSYPNQMEVIIDRYSDYIFLEEDELGVVKAVDKYGWLMRAHSTMSDENKAQSKAYLLLGQQY